MASTHELCYTIPGGSALIRALDLRCSSAKLATSSTTSHAVISRHITPLPAHLSALIAHRDGGFGPGAAAGGTAIVWFRGDLRLHDHPALTHALEEYGRVIPIYIFDPRRYGKTAFGFQKTGRHRAKFLIESVESLRESLRKLGSDLLVRVGHPEQVLPTLAKETRAEKILYHKEVSHEDVDVEVSLEKAIKRTRADTQAFWTNTLYDPEDLPYAMPDDIPDVYTEFREAVVTHGRIRSALQVPTEMPGVPKEIFRGDVPSLNQLGLVEPNRKPMAASPRGGEEEAMERLELFKNEHAANPRGGGLSSRAVDIGTDFSCIVSPWLTVGCISPRKIYNELFAHEGVNGNAKCKNRALHTTTFFELIWRDFFRFLTSKYSRTRIRDEASQQHCEITMATRPAVGAL